MHKYHDVLVFSDCCTETKDTLSKISFLDHENTLVLQGVYPHVRSHSFHWWPSEQEEYLYSWDTSSMLAWEQFLLVFFVPVRFNKSLGLQSSRGKLECLVWFLVIYFHFTFPSLLYLLYSQSVPFGCTLCLGFLGFIQNIGRICWSTFFNTEEYLQIFLGISDTGIAPGRALDFPSYV
jgi:hypothetical protein